MDATATPDWDRHWRAYDQATQRNPAHRFRRKLIFTALERSAAKPLRILDLGCGQGDFLKDSEGRIIGRARHGEKGLAYIGAYLVHPRLFANVRLSKFSMNLLWDRAIADKRLFGIEHKGLWLHVGTPESIALAEGALKEALTLSR